MSFEMKRPVPQDGSVPSLPHIVFSEFASRYPATAAYWASSAWPDGSPKKPARISLGIYHGRLTAQFQLLGTGLMVRVELLDPILVWDALEAVLGSNVVPWEADPFCPADAPKKGKK